MSEKSKLNGKLDPLMSWDEVNEASRRNSSSGSDSSRSSNTLSIPQINDQITIKSNFSNGTHTSKTSSQKHHDSARSSISKEPLFAHTSYADNIDFIKDQENYLKEAGEQDLYQTSPDDTYIIPLAIGGYKIIEQASPANVVSYVYRAVNEATGEAVVIKLSPDITHIEHLARFLNDWYINSGLNPVSDDYLWSFGDVDTYNVSHFPSNVPHKSFTHISSRTLPKDSKGILCPIDEINVEEEVAGVTRKSMALVYPDYNFKSLYDYYSEKIKDVISDKTLFWPESMFSMPSELSSTGNSSVRSLMKSNPDNYDYIELSNRVKQVPKPSSMVIEILGHMIDALEVISSAHKHGICHNGLTSHCIFLSHANQKDKHDVYVFQWDFNFTVAVEDSSRSFRNKAVNNIQNLLHYMSPESSQGGISSVDFRSDIYSAGVILYELIVGCLPFRSGNLASLQRMISDQSPIQPIILGPKWISNDLNYVILKCLNKNPSSRYVTMDALIKDLKLVTKSYLESGKASNIKKGFKDLISRDYREHIPLFHSSLTNSNSPEVRNKVFDCYNSADSRIIVLVGDAGVGKSILGEQILGLAQNRGSLYAHWRYHYNDNNVSKYASSISAVHSVTKQILSSSEEDIKEWRKIFTTEIETDLSILFSAVPNLKILLGPHYDTLKKTRNSSIDEPISPTGLGDLFADGIQSERVSPSIDTHDTIFDEQELNTELKYSYIFKIFFTLVARKGLTVLLENVNFCPPDEYILVSEFLQFCTRSSGANLKFVVSFQSQSSNLSQGHIIKNFLQFKSDASSLDLPVNIFEIPRLDKKNFVDYVEKLNNKPNDIGITERIYSLVDGCLLSFDYLNRYARLTSHKKSSFWVALDERIKSGVAPSSLMAIIAEYLNAALTPEASRMMRFAAAICVNGFFNMSELMIVTGIAFKEINELIHLCLETRVIVPTGICYKVPFSLIANDKFAFDIEDGLVWDFSTRAKFRFDHDVIREFLIKDMKNSKELMEIHRECGLRTKKKISKDVTVNVTSYLMMASHLYRSCDVARHEDYRHYNEALITGGRYAISTSNLSLALKYFTAALNFVHKDDSRRKQKITFTQVQCNYLLKNFDESIRLISQAEMNLGKEDLNLTHLKVCVLFSLRKYEEGMRLAIESLQRLRIDVSADPVALKAIAEKCYTQLPLSVKEIRDLKTLKRATDKSFILISSFIADMINPTYVLDLPDLRITLFSQLVQLMHRHGQNTSCAIPLLHLANYFLQPGEKMSGIKAQELADVALNAIDSTKGASTAFTQSINEAYLVLMGQFKSPVMKVLKTASLIGQDKSSQSGNHFVINWMLASSMFMGSMRGYSKSAFTTKKAIMFANKNEESIFKSMASLWHMELSLEKYLAHIYAETENLGLDLQFVALANAAIKASADQNYQLACELIMGKVFEMSKKTPISISHVWFYFISAISLLSCTAEDTRSKRMKLAKEIESYFKVWSKACYVNFGSESKLISAFIKSHEHGESELNILSLYEEAIEDAQCQKQWLVAAMANRLCAKWLRRVSKSQRRANEYANRAFALYSTMNVYSQAQIIKREFPEISESFNWAGLRQMVSKDKPVMENANFFDNSSSSHTCKGRGTNSESITGENTGYISELASIPKSEDLRNIEIAPRIDPTHHEWTEAIRLCLSISQSSSLDLIVQTLLESSLLFAGVDFGAVILNFQTDEPVIKAIGTSNSLFILDDERLVTRVDLVPYTLVIQCLITGEITGKDNKFQSQDGNENEDVYFNNNPTYSGLCIPIKTSTVIGVLYLESHLHTVIMKSQSPLMDSTKIDLLYLLCSQAAVSFSKSVVYTQMEIAKKAAEEATDEKASFLANMSHEIRTPFNSLLACSIFLLDTQLSAIQKEYVETIKDSALVTLNIIDGILAFTKIEHGSFTLENEIFSINDTIEGAISFSSEKTESEDLEFAYFNKCPQIEAIRGDPTRIRQIIINLVGNALKFTSKGYVKVILDAKPITVSRYELKIVVEDTGIGIPEDSRSKVFGAFSQVDGSSRRVYGGSGLGLAISNKLAEIMNGRITFTSEEGVGSIFSFICPFEITLNNEDPKVDRREVCIVSNTKWKRLALKEAMEYYGATVALFDNVDDVIKNRSEFEILIIDKNLVKEGVKLRSSLKWKRSSIYVLTRFGSMLSDERLQDIEADRVIFSPIKRVSIRKLLEDSFDWKSVPEKIVKGIRDTTDIESSSFPPETTSKSNGEEVTPLNILIAEDNPVNLRVASQHLKKLGYIADHAKDGVQVLEKCEEKLSQGKKYDVIFMDIQMPRKDGIQATIDLRKSFFERGFENFLPQIVALTANVAGEEMNNCIECGMIDFVTKPILPERLKTALGKVIANLEQDNLTT